ncbi:MAG: hypothetical protein WC661_07875 [Opitutaceae bacterium]
MTTNLQRARRIRLILGFAALGLALALLAQRGELGAWVAGCMGFLREAGPGPFFVAMALLPLVGFPLAPFVLAAGPVFASEMGAGNVIACSILAVAVNVALSYWIAARALRPVMVRLLAWLGFALPALPAGSGWEIVLLTRLIPGVPFFMQSYLLGLARVPFVSYLLISTLVMSGYIVASVMAGAAMVHGDRRMLAVAGVIFVLVAVALHRLRKRMLAARRTDVR